MNERAGRDVVERVLISGKLVLETPTHLGNGTPEMLTDMPLLRDAQEGLPLLTGTSLAGALRSYVREYHKGYREAEAYGDLTCQVFGAVENEPGDDETKSVQSWLLVDDALGKSAGIELRDGVGLDEKTRTASDKKKYDIELFRAGTVFDLSLELLIPRGVSREHFLSIVALALHGLESGEIALGMRKRRGFGRCRVTEWCVRSYDLTTKQGLLAWLVDGRCGESTGSSIYELLAVKPPVDDAREFFSIDAELDIMNSLLIRSTPDDIEGPDTIHLQSYRPQEDKMVPILSGTSLAGAIRARALRIANTMIGATAADTMISDMFGYGGVDETTPSVGSRVVVDETVVKQGMGDRVQQRVKIDRFTGGAYPTALFAQQPHFGGKVRIRVTLRSPEPAQIGLLLLVLKDLCTQDLAIGGEQSVGRGRLSGDTIALKQRQAGGDRNWRLEMGQDGVSLSGLNPCDKEVLQEYVKAFCRKGERQ